MLSRATIAPGWVLQFSSPNALHILLTFAPESGRHVARTQRFLSNLLAPECVGQTGDVVNRKIQCGLCIAPAALPDCRNRGHARGKQGGRSNFPRYVVESSVADLFDAAAPPLGGGKLVPLWWAPSVTLDRGI